MVLKIHVSSEVQLPKLIVAPALSRYSWHGFLLLLGELEVTFWARLFLIDTTSLVAKSFIQLKQRHSSRQAFPCEKQGHFVFRCPILSGQEVNVASCHFPSPHPQEVSLAAPRLMQPVHLQAVLHFCFAATHGHLLPLLCRGVSEQDFTLVCKIWILQARHLSLLLLLLCLFRWKKWLFGQTKEQRSPPLSSPKLKLVSFAKVKSQHHIIYILIFSSIFHYVK